MIFSIKILYIFIHISYKLYNLPFFNLVVFLNIFLNFMFKIRLTSENLFVVFGLIHLTLALS